VAGPTVAGGFVGATAQAAMRAPPPPNAVRRRNWRRFFLTNGSMAVLLARSGSVDLLGHGDLSDHPRVWNTVIGVHAWCVERDRLRLPGADFTGVPLLLTVG